MNDVAYCCFDCCALLCFIRCLANLLNYYWARMSDSDNKLDEFIKGEEIGDNRVNQLLLEEVKLIYEKGGDTKQYGIWGKIATRFADVHNVVVTQAQLRKQWHYMHRNYK